MERAKFKERNFKIPRRQLLVSLGSVALVGCVGLSIHGSSSKREDPVVGVVEIFGCKYNIHRKTNGVEYKGGPYGENCEAANSVM